MNSPTSQAVFCHSLVLFFNHCFSIRIFFVFQCWNKQQLRAKASSSSHPPRNGAQPDTAVAPSPFPTIASMQMKSQVSLTSREYQGRGGTSLSLFPLPKVSSGDVKRALILFRSYLNWKRNTFAKLPRAVLRAEQYPEHVLKHCRGRILIFFISFSAVD